VHKKRVSSLGGAIIVDDDSDSSSDESLTNGNNGRSGNGRISNASAATDDGDDSDWSGGETVVRCIAQSYSHILQSGHEVIASKSLATRTLSKVVRMFTYRH
jgi:hypothetical protein